jgi:hypothetical protein
MPSAGGADSAFMSRVILRRRATALLLVGVVLTALSFGFGHRGVHAARSLVVPGAGLYDHRHMALGIGLTVAAVMATYAWLRWGMDWLVLVVVLAAMGTSAGLAYDDHPVQALQAVPAAHEFPLVVLVMGGVSWLRLAWRRTPVGRRRAARSTAAAPVVDQCRAVAIAAIAGSAAAPLDRVAVNRRCRRVGAAARGRFGGDALRIDHAPARAALCLSGEFDDAGTRRLVDDAGRSVLGVPASEPGWVRLLDGTLAAMALQRSGVADAGSRWAAVVDEHFSLRRGHRAGSVWTPVALRGPRSEPWEHAAATALLRAEGWTSDDRDWQALRTRALAAAARGNAVPQDERLVAAGRVWLRFVDDEQAARILSRVTIARDPIAVALDALARSLHPADRQAGRPDLESPRSTR